MTTREPFSDAALEAMLRRRASSGDPGNLREQATAALARTRPGRSWWPVGEPWNAGVPGARLSPVLLVLLLVALVAGATVAGASWLRQRLNSSLPLVPTAVEQVAPGDFSHVRVVEDGMGTMWALGDGQVARLDPASGTSRWWTVSDDASFAARITAPARAGGIWLWSGETIRRFTGEGFDGEILARPHPLALSEAPDGTLWMLSTDAGLERWAGGRWESSSQGLPVDDLDTLLASTSLLLATAPGEVWVVGSDDRAACGAAVGCEVVAHLEKGRWTFYPWADSAPHPVTLTGTATGTIWAGPTSTGAAWFDGDQWVAVDGPGRRPVDTLAAGPDGSVWGVDAEGSLVRREPGGTWTAFGPADGLATDEVVSVAVTAHGVVAGTVDGLFGFSDGQWMPLSSDRFPGSRPGPGLSGSRLALAAITEDEAWATGDEDPRLWHLVDGAWQEVSKPAGFAHLPAALAAGPGGRLWMAVPGRVAVLQPDGWTTAWAADGGALVRVPVGLDVAADGSVWAGTHEGLVHITPDGSGFAIEPVRCPVPGGSVTVAVDGSVWVGGVTVMGLGAPGLAHVTASGCELVDPGLDQTGDDISVQAVVAHPGGGVVVAYEEAVPGFELFHSDATASSVLVRLEGGHPVLLGRASVLSGSTRIAVDARGDTWWAYVDPVVAPAGVDEGPGGLVRLRGDRRVQVVTGGSAEPGPISISPEGMVWFAGSAGIYRIPAGG